jgi:hypothetical protein
MVELQRRRLLEEDMYPRPTVPKIWLVRESMVTGQGEAIRRKPDLVVGGF